jgi:hypothetical protein
MGPIPSLLRDVEKVVAAAAAGPLQWVEWNALLLIQFKRVLIELRQVESDCE